MHITINSPKIWLYNVAVDFRKGISGLTSLISGLENIDVHKDVFVFYNSNISKLKVLAWHRNGFVLIYKCLDRKKFTVSANDIMLINSQQFSWLLAGMDWITMSDFPELEYDNYF